MLDLSNTTLWTIVWDNDSRWIAKAGQVLRYCQTIINFHRTILFTSGRVAEKDYPFDIVQIPKLNWQSYNIFVNRVVPLYVDSDYLMSVHEDGFPIDVSQWRDEFLAYDYVGAPWADRGVGNGGFNLESRKLLETKIAMPVGQEDFELPSDRLICTARKDYLESLGIRFAPFETAIQFSTEQVGNERPSFGFHGRLAAAEKYKKGWKMIQAAPIRQQHGFTLVRNKVVAPARLGHPAPKPVPPLPPRPVQHAARALTLSDGKILRTLPDIRIPANPTATIVYVYPVLQGGKFEAYADRFLRSYEACPPGMDHQTIVVVNNARPTPAIQARFAKLPNLRMLFHDNTGYDLGAFRKASLQCQTDQIVFLGASTFFSKEGWLKRMMEASAKHGLGLYGAMGNKGDARYRVWPHIRTTAFWTHPTVYNLYPRPVKKSVERHAFEHGPHNFSGWVASQGLPVKVVSWAGEYDWANWDDDPEGFQRGKQLNVLAGDHICEPPYYQPK